MATASSRPALPRGLALAGCLLASIVLVSIGGTTPLSAQIRTSPTPGEPPPERPIQPQSRFDRAAATRALDKGTATIRGRACARHSDGLFYANGRLVLLMPVTPYLEEFLALRKGARNGEVAVADPALMETSVGTMTDDDGRFQFTEMRPGRYYLFMVFEVNRVHSRNVYAGSSYGGGMGVDHYERQDYVRSDEDVLEGFVEIEKEGQVVRTTLVNKSWRSKLLRCVAL